MYEIGMIRASDGSPVCDGMLPEDRQYVIHAANYHARLCDIVRRLAELETGVVELEPREVWQTIDDVAKQSAKLWAEMQQEGGGE
jgi:hypothetical protein